MGSLFGGTIHKKCKGCRKIIEHYGKQWCSIYQFPYRWWDQGGCPFNTKAEAALKQKVRVGQQKQKQKGG